VKTQIEPSDLNTFQKIILYLRGYAGVGLRKLLGWRAPIGFYAFRCPEHGLVVDYPHGHRQRLSCPLCSHVTVTLEPWG